MSNFNSQLDLLSANQFQKEPAANALFNAGSSSMLYAMRAKTTSGVTWGYIGGMLQIGSTYYEIDNGSVTLTAAAINFLEVDTSGVDVGKVKVNTTGFTAGKIPLYKVIMGTTGYTDYKDYRNGSTSMGGMVGVVAAATDAATDVANTAVSSGISAHLAASDPHSQYLTPTEGDARYDATGAASAAVAAHVAASNPHAQYLTQTQGDARYALAGQGVSDGDKGDIVVSGSGSNFAIDSNILSTFGRTLIDDANAASARTTLGLGTVATLDIDTDIGLLANSDILIPTQKAVKAYIDSIATSGASDVMILKGVIDCSTNPNYPSADAGHLYKVSVSGKIGGASGVNVEAGDTLYCLTDGTASGNQATVGSAWGIAQANLDGAVIGPGSATNNAVALFDGTSGKLVKDSTTTISTDGTFGANSDAKLPTEKAIKTFVTSAVAGVAGTPGGSTTQLQFNDAGAFGGDDALTWDKTNNILYVGTSAGVAATIKTPNNPNTSNVATLSVLGGDSSTGYNGGDITVKGGSSASTGGAVTVSGGTNTGNGTGGALLLQAGDTNSGYFGGAVTMRGGDSVGDGGLGGNVTIRGGHSNTGVYSGSPTPGNLSLAGGSANGSGSSANGGNATVKGGAGGASNGNGGNVIIAGGAGGGTGARGNVVFNDTGAALATTATGGFTCLPTCAGTPTGVPASIPAGTIPVVFDTTNLKLWAYAGGAWRGVDIAQPFDLTAFYPGVPATSVLVTRVPIARTVVFPANFSGSIGTASVSATASTVFDIRKNGTSVGSITFAAGATTATFTSTSGTAITFAAGDYISIHAPATPDATLADPGFVLVGVR